MPTGLLFRHGDNVERAKRHSHRSLSLQGDGIGFMQLGLTLNGNLGRHGHPVA
ncbi:hypothetical protein BO06_1852 [Burkholderia mallei]|nr:hypothetical protein BO06_1852 [Burkholderia mallei]KGS06443.1 hypothetical protein X977_2958 [Burkholderia pseudomallei MSHR7504]KGU70126.1 hypothetical protein Y035_5370 [Burkholderia pseudomallei MSHR465J]